jgi:hypothetical protein
MYQAAVVIHVIFAVTRLDAMLFLVMVMLPVVRRTSLAEKLLQSRGAWRY